MCPDSYIELIRLLEVRHHLLGFWWSPNSKRDLPLTPRLSYPPGQPQIRNANYVIGMKVSEK